MFQVDFLNLVKIKDVIFSKKCIENDKAAFNEFCTEEIPRCTSSLINKGICGLHDYVNDIEEEYQYFDDPKHGDYLKQIIAQLLKNIIQKILIYHKIADMEIIHKVIMEKL